MSALAGKKRVKVVVTSEGEEIPALTTVRFRSERDGSYTGAVQLMGEMPITARLVER